MKHEPKLTLIDIEIRDCIAKIIHSAGKIKDEELGIPTREQMQFVGLMEYILEKAGSIKGSSLWWR